MALVSDPDIFDPGNPTDVYNMMIENQERNNAFNAEQAEKQMNFQLASNAKAMDFEHREAEINRSWQEYMSNTAYQRQVRDMIAAGLNPVLGVSNSGATTPSGSTGRGSSGSGAAASADNSLNGALSNFVTTLVNSETQKRVTEMQTNASRYAADTAAMANMYGHELSSSASRYGSELSASAAKFAAAASAGAIKYSADRSLEAAKVNAKTNSINNQRNIDWNREYNRKYNLVGVVSDFLNWLNGDKDDPKPDSLLGVGGKYLENALWNGFHFKVPLSNGKEIDINTTGKLKQAWQWMNDVNKSEFAQILMRLSNPIYIAKYNY